MTNAELIAILQRFPGEGRPFVRYAGKGDQSAMPIDRVEMQIDSTPTRILAQNIAWMDLVKEKIQAVLIYGEVRDQALPKPKGEE